MSDQELDPGALIRSTDLVISLEQIVDLLPDTSVIMHRVGENWWRLIYAARSGNWALADYHFRRVRKLESQLAILRPKHRARLERFQTEALPAVLAAMEERDLPRLEASYRAATDLANELHEESGYPYIRWVLPQQAPVGLDLDPATDDEN